MSRSRYAFVLFLFVVGAIARAQQPQTPFIEPAEHMMKVRRPAPANPAATGAWTTLGTLMPINPVHAALMRSGKVLIVSGSGNDPDNHRLTAGVWNPETETIRTFTLAWDMFCNGMVVLPGGQPFVMGGTIRYDPFRGEPRTASFSPINENFADMAPMSGGRWYPTGTTLGDGTVLVVSGLNDTNGATNTTMQRFQQSTNTWTPAGTAFPNVPLYPRQSLLPDGKVFASGANFVSQTYNPVTKSWASGPTTIFGQNRDYGTSVLLPLTPANRYRPAVIIMGGGPGAKNVTDTTEIIDPSADQPAWKAGPKMVRSRVQLNATILPDGKVLVSGGSAKDEDATTAVLEAELYDPATNSFSSAEKMEFPRLYHSNTILLPDATVLAMGGNPARGTYEPHLEIYSPPYLFNRDGTRAKRPVITRHAPDIYYGQYFKVRTYEAARIKYVVLIRPGAVTHAFDMDQRLVGLTFANAEEGALNVQAPTGGNLAPPGWYMLFLVDSAGVPSTAAWVKLTK
jgi:hypothetical protein